MQDRPIKLLLVDDDPDFAEFVNAALSVNTLHPINVDHVSDYPQAERALAGNNHDVYLFDHDLGDSSKTGLDLIKFARDVTNKPLIMLSASNNENTGEHAITLGASDFLPKELATVPMLERVVRNSIKRNDRITSMQNENAILEQQLNKDPVTGISSRVAIERFLDQALEHCKSRQMGVVVYIDLDHFKLINDRYGHPVGDQVLRKISERLLGATERRDSIGRLGGDEFLLVGVPRNRDVFADGTIHRLIRKIRCSVARPIKMNVNGGHHEIQINLSIGVRKYTSEDRNKEKLIAQADRAMYRDKLDETGAHRRIDQG